MVSWPDCEKSRRRLPSFALQPKVGAVSVCGSKFFANHRTFQLKVVIGPAFHSGKVLLESLAGSDAWLSLLDENAGAMVSHHTKCFGGRGILVSQLTD